MAELKKYSSFEALKLDKRPNNAEQSSNDTWSEFEAFLKRLQSEYSNRKKTEKKNGKQPDQ